ncbi:MAG TPA: aspartate aminotransferase family protein [Patescibacteria group bacterium]
MSDVGTRLLTLGEAFDLTPDQNRALHLLHGNVALTGTLMMIDFDPLFTHAYGTKVYDNTGRCYLDFKGGYGALPFGHHPRPILEAVVSAMARPNFLQASLSPLGAVLKQNLAYISPGQALTRSFLCNSGAEAVEGAMKTARLYTGRRKIVYAERGFHGKTFGALSVTGNKGYQDPFGPLVPDCVCIPFGSIAALKLVLRKKDVAAVILEPIQGEGGVRESPTGYLREVARLCRENGTLLIVDEIQTGLGRTGRMFACEEEGVVPDILCVAKALSGGVIPIGAFLTTDEIWFACYGNLDTFALHTSTFGENSLACAAAIASIHEIVNQNLCEEARRKGRKLLTGLRSLQEKYPSVIHEVRGKGLLIGVELKHWAATGLDFLMKGTGSQLLGSLVAGKLLVDHGIITVYTLNKPRVIRVEPPLTVTDEEIEYFLQSFEAVLAGYKGFPALMASKFGNGRRLNLAMRVMRGVMPVGQDEIERMLSR